MSLTYNDYIGRETIVREYKEFTLVPDIDQKDAEKLIKSSEWMFNYNIKDGLLKYIKNFVPKYISAFMESKSKTPNGELYFGINDFGFVHGIPYQLVAFVVMRNYKIPVPILQVNFVANG